MKGRKKELTAFGATVFETLSNRFTGVDDELRQVHCFFQNPEQAHLRIGGRVEILNHFAKSIRFPGRMTYSIVEGQAAVSAVQDRKIDLAITNRVGAAENLIAKKAFTDRFVLAINKDVAAAHLKGGLDKRFLSLAQVNSIWYREPHPHLYEALDKLKIPKDDVDRFQPKQTIGNWLTITELLRSTKSWSIAPLLYVENEKSIITFSLDDLLDTEVQFYFLFRTEFRKVDWFKKFLNTIQPET